jgi:hypothetical protein
MTHAPTTRVLLVTHGDGWLEVYGAPGVTVHHATMPSVAATHETLAESIVEAELPRAYRDIYWPGNRRYCGMVERRTVSDEIARRVDLATYHALTAMGQAVRDSQEATICLML